MKRIAFLNRGFENLGVQILQAVCEDEGVETRAFVDPAPDAIFQSKGPLTRLLGVHDRLIEDVSHYRPDVLCISAFTSTWPVLARLAAAIRSRTDVVVAVGGVAPTVTPDRIVADPNVDWVCAGEGESVMAEICRRLRKGDAFHDIPGLRNSDGPDPTGEVDARGSTTDLDALPFPRKEDFFRAGAFRHTLRVLTGRGCPHACTFCQNRQIAGPRGTVRRHSPDYLFTMLAHLSGRFPVRRILFADSTFNARRDFLESFLPHLPEKIGLPYYCTLFAGEVDRALATLLAKTGCKEVFVGMEAGDENFRMTVYRKRITDGNLVQAVRDLKTAGVNITLSVIFGAPGETPEHFERTFRMIETTAPTHLSTFTFFPQPGTPLTERAIEEGLVERDFAYRTDLYHGTYVLRHPHALQAQTANNLVPLYFIMPGVLRRVILRACLSGRFVSLSRWLWKLFIPLANPTFGFMEYGDALRTLWRVKTRLLQGKDLSEGRKGGDNSSSRISKTPQAETQ